MTNLAVQGIQSFARGGVRSVTQLAISTATSAITRALDNRVFEGPRLESFQLQTSRDGAAMPRVFGRVRLAGQVIWASQVREQVSEESVGGKGGGPTQRNYSYSISFAVGLCEGEILGVDRVWANGEILQRSGLTVRVHTGSDTQGPDPVIAATEPGIVPAFRGTAYLVFEDFPLDDYGARLPIINAEVVRGVKRGGRMEDLVQSVNLLPGTGEFALSPTIVEETPTVGVTAPFNMNSFTGQADLLTSLDQLQAELPNCRHVNIICAWFGSSLDAGDCEVQPGAERRDRRLPDAEWRVAGFDRRNAYIVSADAEDRPNYGGTPSDDSIIACIQTLKRRGFAVTLYPFLLMDTPGFPWRGRITAGSTADVSAFFGTDNDLRFRHHILHHARLAQQAGGIDAIVIGSELKALMAYRTGESFPAVTQMQSLAAATRAIVGPATKITYAADWSDYFGVQDGGDLRYHLDPLWADDNIDAIGIDAYFPLSDWRDGDHLDGGSGRRAHDLDYLAGNVEGGEGYDWYYASPADRDAQVRSAIDDPVYRYKDLRSWWSQPHIERRNGVSVGESPWLPRSKPIWLLEIGCPAVDKGANQPNVFNDDKSVDAALPYYSDGGRDDLIQRRYIEAILGHYDDTNEPGFLDLSRASVWAWDARPYPDFPARTAVWSDGSNWARGHWLNGRTGLMPVADIIDELARDSGLVAIDVSGVSGVLPGYVIDRPMSARAALGPLMQLFAVDLAERSGDVVFAIGGPETMVIAAEDLVSGPVTRSRADAETRIRDVRLTYIDAARDYQLGTASARERAAQTVAVADLGVPAVLDESFARYVAQRELAVAHAGDDTLSFAMPLETGLALEIGDRVSFEAAVWAVETLEIGASVGVTLRRDLRRNQDWVSGTTPARPATISYAGPAQLLAFDLPGRNGVSVGALLDPFSPVTVQGPDTEITLDAPVRLGVTLTALSAGSVLFRDRSASVDVLIPGLALSALEDDTFLAGGNRFAFETDQGWEIIAARDAVLIGPQTYRLSHLLRGLDGSADFMAQTLPSGARVLWLGAGVASLPLTDEWRGTSITLSGSSGFRAAWPAEIVWNNVADLPLSPVHLRWDGSTLSWIGRDRAFTEWTEDSSHLRYRAKIYRGSAIETIETALTSISPTPFDEVEIYQISQSGRESLFPATLNVTSA
jgi:hypothetical protein